MNKYKPIDKPLLTASFCDAMANCQANFFFMFNVITNKIQVKTKKKHFRGEMYHNFIAHVCRPLNQVLC